MSICKMTKIMIVSHHSEATELLGALQDSGICQVLSAEESVISKEFPELILAGDKPKETEDALNKVKNSIAFLKKHAKAGQDIISSFAPRAIIERSFYENITSDSSLAKVINDCSSCESRIESLELKIEHLTATTKLLAPWSCLEMPVEEINSMVNATGWVGFIATRLFADLCEKITEAGGVVERICDDRNNIGCMVVCLNECASEINRIMRMEEFDNVTFAGMSGLVKDLIADNHEKLAETRKQLKLELENASGLADRLLELKTLSDNYGNQLSMEQTKSKISSTDQTVLMEGWVKEKDFKKLEKIISKFKASCFEKIKPAEDEDIPVEIENNRAIRPFEVITRLYGMPRYADVDPTAFLAPFFAIFFGLCLTDAGYALIIIALSAYLIKKMQGDKKLLWMLGICSVVTIGIGALTGGWFSDGVQQLSAAFGWTFLADARVAMMWFDPIEDSMTFFKLALALGYIHIMFGLMIAFVHNLCGKKFIDAICDQMVWLVMLNAIVLYMFGEKFGLSKEACGLAGKVALVPAVMIVLFSQRQGGWGGRLGMGCYNLFSAIFYMGDVLSYLRLMALGMVTGGFGMAINIMAKTASDIPY
ncbi:MAG TPA: V-type ATPase 116kDa subunit family protein, partial [Sedimentisphaerales bacterium]|nr:V-type ATPase 116kDa subunit family protein [Sedimentisphaerales bacterium]